MEKTREGYNSLYKQYDMKETPYGHSKEYDLWRASKVKTPICNFIKETIKPEETKILDVGGGYGATGNFLFGDNISSKNDIVFYVNLDVSNEMLKYSPYSNILGIGESIPFSDNSFDYIVMTEVLEHVIDKEKTLQECYRVLKLNGILLITTPRTGWLKGYFLSPFIGFMLFYGVWSIIKKLKRKIEGEIQVYPEGVKDEPTDELLLRSMLISKNFDIIDHYRIDNHVPWGRNGSSKFWMWFSDTFINQKVYGHCVFIVGKKRDEKNES